MERSAAEREIAAAVDQLFRRLPHLVGFSVQDAQTFANDRVAGQLERELVLADIAADPYRTQPPELFGEIAVALLDLLDEEPAVRPLLVGRTFTRTLH